MKTNVIKIVLDVVMVVVLVLMYKLNAISISFHEIGGLAVCGLFVIHNGINRKWITGVSKRLFGAPLPIKTRIGYAVDLLLLVSVAFIALSGVLISRTILTSIYASGVFWTLGHFFAAALALVLCGVHIGLHWSFLRSMFARVVKVPRVIARPLGIACLVAVVVYGGYSTVTSKFNSWLSVPYVTLTSSGAEAFLAIAQGNQGGGQGSGAHGVGSGGALSVIATFGSIMAVPAVVTIAAETAIRKARRSKLTARTA